MVPTKIFYIPSKTKYIVVSDMFASDYSGGAELTLDAILANCSEQVFKIHSHLVTPELVEKNKNKIWILANFVRTAKDSLIELVSSNVKFYVIEYDYKYCIYRSAHLHELKENKKCDCHKKKNGIFIRAFYQRAQKVFFMSESQMQQYITLFPTIGHENFVVQSSTFTKQTLKTLANFRKQRKKNKTNNIWAIMSGGSWIKAERETIEWCEKNNLQYELIGGLEHHQFLKKLSEYKGLVFRPAGFDTCPRLVIEAKLLGLDLKLNDNVQHKEEKWFSGSIEQTEKYLNKRAEHFWKKINE